MSPIKVCILPSQHLLGDDLGLGVQRLFQMPLKICDIANNGYKMRFTHIALLVAKNCVAICRKSKHPPTPRALLTDLQQLLSLEKATYRIRIRKREACLF